MFYFVNLILVSLLHIHLISLMFIIIIIIINTTTRLLSIDPSLFISLLIFQHLATLVPHLLSQFLDHHHLSL